GSYQDAAENARAARSGTTSDDVANEWLWRSVEARLAARRGDAVRADGFIQAAQRFLAKSDSVVARGTCLLDEAEGLSLRGRPKDAAAATRKAVRMFEKKGDVVRATKAREFLAETTKSP